MIRNHLVGEAFGLLVPLISRELARLDLEHVADGGTPVTPPLSAALLRRPPPGALQFAASAPLVIR